jgi:hypothetical protein
MCAERRPDHHQRHRNHDEYGQRDGEPDGHRFHLPPRAAFLNVVRLVQRADNRVHSRRHAPNRAEHAECQKAAVLIARNLENLFLHDIDDVARRHTSEHCGDAADEPADRQEADERDDEQERRKQGQKEIEGELRGEVQAVIRPDLACRASAELFPADRQAECVEHQ